MSTTDFTEGAMVLPVYAVLAFASVTFAPFGEVASAMCKYLPLKSEASATVAVETSSPAQTTSLLDASSALPHDTAESLPLATSSPVAPAFTVSPLSIILMPREDQAP